MASKLRLYQPRAILVQLLGVLVSEKWKQGTYVREKFPDFLIRNERNPEVLLLIESLRAVQKTEDGSEVPTIEEDTASSDDILRSLLAYLDWQTSLGRSNEPTQRLEGLVRRDGYERGELETAIFDDVLPALQNWAKLGIKVYLDTPTLSRIDGNLIMKSTSVGDLRSYFKGIFGNEDPRYMTSDSNLSYRNIFTRMMTPFSDILYITHLGQKAKQVSDTFGIESLMVDRSENRKIRSYYLVRFKNVLDFSEIEFVTKRTVRSVQ